MGKLFYLLALFLYSLFFFKNMYFFVPKFWYIKKSYYLCNTIKPTKVTKLFILTLFFNQGDKSMKTLIKLLAENTGYIFFAVVIACIVVRILQLIEKLL